MYNNGQGVKRNYKEAARLYRLSAKQGNARAHSNLGIMYNNGQGVRQNKKEAKRFFRLSAKTLRKSRSKK
jgi:TPR repeat protein